MIVVFATPAMGHTKPMIPILAGLVANGCRIVCFGHKAFEGVIRSSGAEFRAYPDVAYNIDAPDFNLLRMGADLIQASEIIYPQLLPQVAELHPNLILQDFMALWASRIGTTLDIARIHTVPTLVFNRPTQRKMRKEDGIAKLAKDVFYGSPALARALVRSRFAVSIQEAYGVERSWRRLRPPIAELVFNIKELQVGDLEAGVPRHYIGPTINEARHHEPPAARGYALITFGTLSNNETGRFEAAMRGAVMGGFSVVVQCGRKVNLDHLQKLAKTLAAEHPGKTVTVLDSVTDMEVLIMGADVVIHHAGMATTWETVRYAKPALFIPTIADQKVFASQLEKRGFGVRLPRGREFDPRAIAQGLRSAMNRHYDWPQLQGLVARARGAPRGVEIILDALRAGR
ncbi:MAG: hypothetical protein JNK47_17780 [Mesorhizobium sp.]|nr:glycosyltransferase [Mesorhizobium sp.]MBL8579073.1 hypothetical protein [Mesorhizobium sp.]